MTQSMPDDHTLSATGRPTLATILALVAARPGDPLAAAEPAIHELTETLDCAPEALEADKSVLEAAVEQAGRPDGAKAQVASLVPHIRRARTRKVLPATPKPTGVWVELADAAKTSNQMAVRALFPVLTWLGYAPEDVDDAVLDDVIQRLCEARRIAAEADPAAQAEGRFVYARRVKAQWNQLAEDYPLPAVQVPYAAANGPAISADLELDIDTYLAQAAAAGPLALAASTRNQRRDLLARAAARATARGCAEPRSLADLLAPATVIEALNGAIAAAGGALSDGEVRNTAKALKHVAKLYIAADPYTLARLDRALSRTAATTHRLPDAAREQLLHLTDPATQAAIEALPARIARAAGYGGRGGLVEARVACVLALVFALATGPKELARMRRGDIDLGDIGTPSVIRLPARAHATTDAIQTVEVGPTTTVLLHRYFRKADLRTAPSDAPLLTNADPNKARDTLLTQLRGVLDAHGQRDLTLQRVQDALALAIATTDGLATAADSLGISDRRGLERRLAPLLDFQDHPRTA